MENHGKMLGVPYDFRRPTLARIRERMWNPDDPRVVTPRVFGVGWTLNLATLRERSTVGFAIAVAALALIYLKALRSMLRSLSRLRSRD